MRKQLFFVAMLALAVGGLAFANGQTEAQDSFEPVTLTGTVHFEGIGHPQLKTADGVYELMVPMYLADQVHVEEGQEITVDGYVVPGPRWERETDRNYVRVTGALIDGEEYEVDGDFQGHCCDEPPARDWGRRGMHGRGAGSRGRRGWAPRRSPYM